MSVPRPIPFRVIVNAACLEAGVGAADFTGTGRHPRVVLCREVAWRVARRLTDLSWPAIARESCRPKHTTVFTAVKRHEGYLKSGNAAYDRAFPEWRQLERRVEARVRGMVEPESDSRAYRRWSSNKAAAMYADGASWSQVGRYFGVSDETARARCRRDGYAGTRPRGSASSYPDEGAESAIDARRPAMTWEQVRDAWNLMSGENISRQMVQQVAEKAMRKMREALEREGMWPVDEHDARRGG